LIQIDISYHYDRLVLAYDSDLTKNDPNLLIYNSISLDHQHSLIHPEKISGIKEYNFFNFLIFFGFYVSSVVIYDN